MDVYAISLSLYYPYMIIAMYVLCEPSSILTKKKLDFEILKHSYNKINSQSIFCRNKVLSF